MFGLSEHHHYYLYRGVTDMRKGFNGLSGIVRNSMSSDPMDGSVYLFINRRRDKLKILVWTQGGYVLYYKRLEQGTFELPKNEQQGEQLQMSWETLVLMVRGIRLEKVNRKKRYVLQRSVTDIR